MDDSAAVDSIIRDGLWCASEDWHMGMAAERVAERFSITRAQQDAYALESHARAAAAQRAGNFAVEIASIILPEKASTQPAQSRDAALTVVSRDESVRDLRSEEHTSELQS